MSGASTRRRRVRPSSSEENGFGGLYGPRKPYSQRPGAGAFHRCIVPVAQTRHGEPPLTCGGLIFGRDLVQHLVDCHDIPAGPMSPAELALAYQDVVQVPDDDKRTGSHAAICSCGAKMKYGAVSCRTCWHARQSAAALVPKGTSNAEALKLYRARARDSGKCAICRARDAEPDYKCCAVCQLDKKERYHAAKGETP